MSADKRAHDCIEGRDSDYHDLREATREWLDGKSGADLVDIDEAIKFYRSVKTIGKFWKWLIITVIGCFLGAAQFGESIQKLFGFLFPGKHP